MPRTVECRGRYGVLMCVEGDSRITPCLIAFHCASSSKPPKDDNHYVSLTLTTTRMSERNKGWATQTFFATILFDRSPGGQSETSLPFIQTQTICRQQKEMEGVALGFSLCAVQSQDPPPPPPPPSSALLGLKCKVNRFTHALEPCTLHPNLF